MGGFLILEYQKSFSSPLPLATLNDKINVDLTPIIGCLKLEIHWV